MKIFYIMLIVLIPNICHAENYVVNYINGVNTPYIKYLKDKAKIKLILIWYNRWCYNHIALVDVVNGKIANCPKTTALSATKAIEAIIYPMMNLQPSSPY